MCPLRATLTRWRHAWGGQLLSRVSSQHGLVLQVTQEELEREREEATSIKRVLQEQRQAELARQIEDRNRSASLAPMLQHVTQRHQLCDESAAGSCIFGSATLLVW
jgi:hypothetical protein